MRLLIILAVFGCLLTTTHCSTVEAQQPFRSAAASVFVRPVLQAGMRRTDPSVQWYPYVIAPKEDRAWIRETPMENRPNRPLHFWGNSRRRTR